LHFFDATLPVRVFIYPVYLGPADKMSPQAGRVREHAGDIDASQLVRLGQMGLEALQVLISNTDGWPVNGKAG
jgi:hypothetical protein